MKTSEFRFLAIAVLFSMTMLNCASPSKMVRPEKQKPEVSLKARDYFLKGLFLQQEARFNEALVQYYQALHHDSTSATIYNTIAQNHMKLGHYESAQLLLHKGLEIEPRSVEGLSLLAECHFRLGQDEQAIEAYKKLLDIDPYNDDARQYLILLYEKNGDELGVAEQNEELLNIYGRDEDLLFRLAGIYLRNQEYDKALHYYNEILEVDSTNARVYYMVGRIQETQSGTEAAKYSFEQAVNYDPRLREAVDQLTRIYRSNQEWQKIIDLYKPVLEADSLSLPARVLCAEAHFYLDQYDQARSLLIPLLTREDVPLSIYELLGRIELESDQPEKAEEYFRKIVEEDPDNKFARLFLGFTYTDMQQPVRAQETFEEALQKFPDDATLWSFYGINQQEQLNYQKAIKAFGKALELDPENVNALTNLPISYEALNMFERSDSLYEAALQKYPDNALLLNNYSYSLSERNMRLETALAMAEKAVEAQPDNPAYLDTIGWIHYKLGNFQQAERYISRAVGLRETSAVVLEHLGDVYLALGDTEKAFHFWVKSLNLEPDNSELIKKVEKIKK